MGQERSDRTKRYAVTVPALPGCITDGETIEQALERAQETMSLYLQDEDEAGLPVVTNRPELIVASIDVAIPA